MLHDQTNGIKNRHKQKHETYEIEHKFKARRAQGGKDPLSQSISIQNVSRNHPPKTTPRDEKERTREEESREMAPGEEVGGLVWLSGARGEKGVVGVFMVPTQRFKIPLDSN